MKTKPILIAAAAVIVLSSVCFFMFGRNNGKLSKSQIKTFLSRFSNLSKEGDTDSLLLCFDKVRDTKNLKNMLSFLSGRTDFRGNKKVLAYISMDIDDSDIKVIGVDYVNVTIPVKIVHDSLDSRSSEILFKIHRIAPNRFKIMHYDAKKLLADYLAYEEYVKDKTVPQEIFTPAALAAFKTAQQLKAKYDSVIWFAYSGDKTYFYVVKGKLDMGDNDLRRTKNLITGVYKMGLVGPGLTEIIPVEYNLIHNINGTFNGLVEVEKGKKRGFYDLDGKIAVPVIYDQIFPIEGMEEIAVLKNGDEYFYLKKDLTVSDKVDLKTSDFFSKIRNITGSVDLSKNALNIITEYNSQSKHAAVYLPPSYLVDLNMIGQWEDFKNPSRKVDQLEDVHEKFELTRAESTKNPENWFEGAFYAIRDYFLGGRVAFYDTKNLIIVDKKHDRVLTQEIRVDYSRELGDGMDVSSQCNVNSIKAINDTLLEVKIGASMGYELYDSTKTIEAGTHYNYLAIRNNKLMELPDDRLFGFTKYVKIDDPYLYGCYNLSVGKDYKNRHNETVDHITPEMLRYMKNEIYADYRYEFKDKRWQAVFQDMQSYTIRGNREEPNNVTVDDSLTEIDKYNINWINQKLKGVKPKVKSNSLATR